MSDEKKSEGAVESALNSPLWKSWVGKLAALVAFWWVAPMDKVLEEAIKPSVGVLDSALKLAWTKGLRLSHWMRRYAYVTLGFSLAFGGVCLLVMAYGVGHVNPYLVALGGGVWSLYLIALWFVARTTLAPLTELAGIGLDLTGTVLGGVLRKIGFTKAEKDKPSVINLDGVSKFLNDSFVLVIVSLVTSSLVTLVTYVSDTPPWWSCGAFVIGGLVLSVTLSVGAFKEIPFADGWKLLHKWSYRTALLLAGFGLVVAILPSLRGRVTVIRSGADAWLANPHFQPGVAVLLALPILAIAIFLVASVWYGTEPKKSGTFRLLAKLMIIPLVGMPIVLIALGMITPREIATASSRVQAGVVSAVLPNKTLKPASETGDIAPPRLQAVPTAVPVPTKAPVPDLSGMGVDDILGTMK